MTPEARRPDSADGPKPRPRDPDTMPYSNQLQRNGLSPGVGEDPLASLDEGGLSALRKRDGLDEAELGALWSRVVPETVKATPSLRGKLRELSTARRVALSVAGAFVVAVVALLIGGMRVDMGTQTVMRYAVAMLGILVLTGATFAVSLRGHHQKPLGPVAVIVVALSVLVPVLLAVMPWLWEPGPAFANIPVSHVCLELGISTGLIAGAIAWCFQRDEMSGWVRALSAAGGGGLVGFAMLQLHCPAHDATHLLIGHAGVGLFLVLVTSIVVLVRRSRQRRAG
jgi:hypothetical protein